MIGYRIMQEPGTVVWNELMTTDSKKAAAFYKAVLPADIAKMPGSVDYTLIKVQDQQMAGIFQIMKEMGPMPPHWFVFFTVADVDKSAKKASSLKGKISMPPQDIPNVGRFAVLQDPQGAAFGLFTPLEEMAKK
jgi:predicted enzyme related to lactoylglutathione lyase